MILREIQVSANSQGLFFVQADGLSFRCAVGAAGIKRDKREGDLGTPAGRFALRRLFYRPDRLERPETLLDVIPLTPDSGWCVDPESPFYNKFLHLPFEGAHEILWRDDHAYDLFAELDHNCDPAQAGHGSAIFFHIARDDYAPTQGCIAISLADWKTILPRLDSQTFLYIAPPS